MAGNTPEAWNKKQVHNNFEIMTNNNDVQVSDKIGEQRDLFHLVTFLTFRINSTFL